MNIKGLDVTYNGTRVNENSYLVKAFFLYQGKDDITSDKATKPIYLELPNNSIWHDCKLTSKSKDLEVEYEIVDNRVNFSYDLLKNNDYFSFEIFVEISVDNTFNNIYEVSHRIVNLDPIKIIRPNDTVGLSAGVVVSGIVLIFLLMPLITTFINSNDSETGETAYYSDNVSKIYYLDDEQVDIDSIDNIFSYRAKELNSYLNQKDHNYSLMSPEMQKEYDDLTAFQNAFHDVYVKPLQIYKKYVSDKYGFFSLLKIKTTEKYVINKKFKIQFVIDYREVVIGILIYAFFVSIILIFFLIALIDWLRSKRVSKQINLITQNMLQQD